MSVQIKLEVTDVVAGLLAVLHPSETLDPNTKVQQVIERLIDHAQQGVYRPGAWERDWLRQAFSSEFEDRLEPGDPYGRGLDRLFEKPKL